MLVRQFAWSFIKSQFQVFALSHSFLLSSLSLHVANCTIFDRRALLCSRFCPLLMLFVLCKVSNSAKKIAKYARRRKKLVRHSKLWMKTENRSESQEWIKASKRASKYSRKNLLFTKERWSECETKAAKKHTRLGREEVKQHINMLKNIMAVDVRAAMRYINKLLKLHTWVNIFSLFFFCFSLPFLASFVSSAMSRFGNWGPIASRIAEDSHV